MNNSVFDYIVVGAGSAGCAMADKLSQSGEYTVLLIESGPIDDNILIKMPKGLAKLLGDERYNWLYPTKPEKYTEHADEVWIRGKTLGGSSSINGMVYNRGQPADFDELEKIGCEGWNWKNILRQYKEFENHPFGANDWRGEGGGVHVQIPKCDDELSLALIQAGKSLGLNQLEDINGDHGDGAIGPVSHTIGGGQRCSSAKAFLTDARSRQNLYIITDTSVERIVFEGVVATSVICNGGSGTLFQAKKEIILCAGALSTPLILMRSGVGEKSQIEGNGISVVHDNPSVGKNLREHRVLYVKFRLKNKALSDNKRYSGLALYKNVIKYFLTKKGIMAEGSFKVGAFVKSDENSDRPDAQILFTPYAIDVTKFPLAFEPYPSFTLFGFILRPESKGEIRLGGAFPSANPIIKPNYLTSEYDKRIAVSIAKYIRKIANEAPLRELIEEETEPGLSALSDDELLNAWGPYGGCGYHAVGTCRMGDDAESVVDAKLRVKGVQGLRIVDTSILPYMISGNLNGPIMAISRYAAEMILEDVDGYANSN